jgi:hypothetical protein
MWHNRIVPLMMLLPFLGACAAPAPDDLAALEKKTARFAVTDLTGDMTALSPGDRQALSKIIEAARLMDRIYMRQMWSGGEAMLAKLRADDTPAGRARLRYFQINMGPFSRLDHGESFVPGAPPKPPEGANYYPADLTKEEFNRWLETLTPGERAKATGFFHVVRRDAQGKLVTVPYSKEYREFLEPAASLLRAAAALTDNPSLRSYLSLRADAFLNDDYYASDVAWMELDSPVDVTIGPYEVYMDELFNYKAAFEAYVTLRNEAETRKLDMFSTMLQEVEDSLPIEPAWRNPKLGASAPIRVVDEVFIGGEARAGVQTAAFNLPNDERVIREKGSKRVMLKNVQEAKFEKVLRPIAARTLDPAQRNRIAFDPFFTHILAHELMHGLGPHSITVDGRETTVRQEMKELSSAFEEAKADISGLWMLQHLIDKGAVPRETEEPMYITFLAGVFRSVRFGINEAHGRGMAMQFNWLADHGAFPYDEAAGTFRVDVPKAKAAARELTTAIMTIQARGDYAAAKAMLDTYAVIRPPMRKALDRLEGIPVDIAPRFPQAGE